MYTDEQLEMLEEGERVITDEGVAAVLLLLSYLGNDLENELRKFYQKYGKDGVITYSEARKWIDEKDHRKRLFVLYLALDEHFNNSLEKVKVEFRDFLTGVVKLEGDFFDVDLDQDKLLTKPWGQDYLTWLERLEEDFEYYEAKLFSNIKTAMIREFEIGDVIDELDNLIGSFGKTEQALGITESTTINSFARKEIMKAKGAKKYRFYAREDERTCEHCGALHGKVFPIAQFEVGVTASPIHPRCRCWEVPIINGD